MNRSYPQVVSLASGVLGRNSERNIRPAPTMPPEIKGDAMVLLSVEKYYYRGTEGYEEARRETVWNGLLPDRFPDLIVQAHDTADVFAAIRSARANGHR